MPRMRKPQPLTRGEEFLGLFAGALGGYMAAEGLLAAFVHGFHWLAAGVAGAAGYFGVLLWFTLKRARRQRQRR